MRIPYRRLILGLALTACGQLVVNPHLSPRESPPSATGVLKAHMNSGDLFMLTTWSVDTTTRRVSGVGTWYDAARVGLAVPEANFSLDSVALFETNSTEVVFPLGAQGVVVVAAAGAVYAAECLRDPKSCFGSCPTFYIEGEPGGHVEAEGFSASIARVLEARDVDVLLPTRPHGRQLALLMKNEALETHAIRRVSVLAVNKPSQGRVFATSDSAFYSATNIESPRTCTGPDGDCLATLSRNDRVERWTPADSHDLAAREVVELTFPRGSGRRGLVIAARSSLVSTFLFYQSMGYLGSRVGDELASMERNGRVFAESRLGMSKALGTIEVQVPVDGNWVTVGEFGEPGPIASDTKVIPLPAAVEAADRVRLRMARGGWRVDWVAIATLGDRAEPVRLRPSSVERDGHPDARALESLRAGSRHLISLPGDEFRLVFDLPSASDSLELFLESEGFYYEWMRTDWLADENAVMAAMVLLDPAAALRTLAPAYKTNESRMEALFQSSRFRRSDRSSR
jgi:hypothetical protein